MENRKYYDILVGHSGGNYIKPASKVNSNPKSRIDPLSRRDIFMLTTMIMIVFAVFLLANVGYHLKEIHKLLLKQEIRMLQQEVDQFNKS